VQTRQHTLYFCARQDDRQALRPLGAYNAFQPGEVELEDIAVQEEQTRKRLVLRRRRHLAVNGQRRQELFEFRRAHLFWVAVVVKPDEPANPVQIRLFGPIAHVPRPDAIPDLIQKARRLGHATILFEAR
jgi:hypothetical protein